MSIKSKKETPMTYSLTMAIHSKVSKSKQHRTAASASSQEKTSAALGAASEASKARASTDSSLTSQDPSYLNNSALVAFPRNAPVHVMMPSNPSTLDAPGDSMFLSDIFGPSQWSRDDDLRSILSLDEVCEDFMNPPAYE